MSNYNEPTWAVALRAAVATLDLATVQNEASRAFDKIHAACSALPLSYGYEPWSADRDPADCESERKAANMMRVFMQINEGVVTRALDPYVQVKATECSRVLLTTFNDLSDDVSRMIMAWIDAKYGDTFFPELPHGPPKLAVECLFVKMSAWTGTCYRCAGMVADITRVYNHEPVARAVERSIWLYAGMFDLDCVDDEWRDLAFASLFEPSQGEEMDLDDDCPQTQDQDKFLLWMTTDEHTNAPWCDLHPAVHQLFHVMRAAREKARDELGLPPSQVDECTLTAAWTYLAEQKSGLYRALWRKWWKTWTVVSFWIQTTGEHQGAVGAPIGNMAIVAYGVEMGETQGRCCGR